MEPDACFGQRNTNARRNGNAARSFVHSDETNASASIVQKPSGLPTRQELSLTVLYYPGHSLARARELETVVLRSVFVSAEQT